RLARAGRARRSGGDVPHRPARDGSGGRAGSAAGVPAVLSNHAADSVAVRGAGVREAAVPPQPALRPATNDAVTRTPLRHPVGGGRKVRPGTTLNARAGLTISWPQLQGSRPAPCAGPSAALPPAGE